MPYAKRSAIAMKALGQVFCYSHGAMFAPGASDAYRQIGFALFPKEWDQVREKVLDPLQKLFGFPVIGTNAAFQKFPHLDALAFGDSYFADKWHDRLKIWQELRGEKPILFWQNYGGGSDLYRVFTYTKGQPSRPIYENIPGRVNPVFALKHSIITAAINCAYYLGAKEIYLLGVEFGPGHFYDPDGKIYKDLGKVHDRFPHVEKIIPFIARQKEELARNGVVLATCWDGESAIKDILDYVSLDETADGRYLTQLFGG